MFVARMVLLSPYSSRSSSSTAALVLPSLSSLRSHVLAFLSSPQAWAQAALVSVFKLELKLLLRWFLSPRTWTTATLVSSLSLSSSYYYWCPGFSLFELNCYYPGFFFLELEFEPLLPWSFSWVQTWVQVIINLVSLLKFEL